MLRIENAFVSDGSGGEPFRATVLVDGGSILAVSREKLAGFSSADTMNRYMKKSAGLTACALRERMAGD